VQSRRQVEDFITAEIDLSVPPATAWGLTKSAWSYREFSSFMDEAMKNGPQSGSGR